MEKELVIKPKSLGGLVRGLSGLFITPANPNGLTNKECTVLAILISIVGDQKITKDHKVQLSNQLNQSLQVTTNYLAKFTKKGCIINNELHKLFRTKITIDGTHLL